MDKSQIEVDEDSVPWASPEIQAAYEAALGRFMLAFNRLDNLLTEVIGMVLKKAGRADLIEQVTKGRDFASRLLTLDLLKSSMHGAGIADVPVNAIKDVASHRNAAAHGHFDQNPYSGEFDIVGKGKRAKYSTEDLNRHTKKATEAWTSLRHAEAYYEFESVLLPDSL